MIKDFVSAKQVLGLGLISGSRSTLATALVAHYLNRHPNDQLAKSRLGFIQSPVAAVLSKVFAGGEIVADKLPGIPDRIIAPAITARIISGAVAGAVSSTANKENVAKGMVIGALAALASTYLLFFLRKKISSSGFIPEPWTGVAEDVAAIGSGVLLMR